MAEYRVPEFTAKQRADVALWILLRPVLQEVDGETQAFILWVWQHRQELNLNVAADIPQELQAIVRVVWDILDLFHRSSSLAESLHS